MAEFKASFNTLMGLEFSNPKNFLHKNAGENDYTVGGIYRTAHPNWVGWQVVDIAIHNAQGSIQEASQELHKSDVFIRMIEDFYKANFWLRMKLNKINSQQITDELFIFGVNAGCRNAIRKAQRIVGASPDGLIGPMTIAALNAYSPDSFDMQFDEVEKQFYDDLIKAKPSFAMFKNGWHNRADAV